jgi:hypothetical protein
MSYSEYLQDSKTWLENGIADHFIPQLYRYNFNDYKLELQNAIVQVGTQKNRLFPGILMNIGTGANEYVISADYLLKAIKENRANGVMGEAHFYYEGLRKNNNLLGDTLKATYYKERAILPERGIEVWRFPSTISNEDDQSNIKIGNWSLYQMKGFNGGIIRANDSSRNSSLVYNFQIPYSAFYDVYIYRVPNTPWTKQARYTLFSKTDSSVHIIDQSDLTKKGWHKLGTVQLNAGNSGVLKLDNSNTEAGKYTVADAAMVMINRVLSPDVVSSVKQNFSSGELQNHSFELFQNYPNPFNPTTVIRYKLHVANFVSLKVYDTIGREVITLVNGIKDAGFYSATFIATSLPSGMYFARLQSGDNIQVKKMMVIK